MNRRPTSRSAVVSTVGGLLVGVATTSQSGWLFVLAAGVLGLVAAGFLSRQRMSGACVTRVVPARARVGESVRVELALHNATNRRLPAMRVEDFLPAFEDLAVACESVPGRSTATISLERTPVRRGVFDGSVVVLSNAAPFGLVRTRRTVDVPSPIVVHPALVDVSSFTLPETPAQTADEALAVDRSGHGDVFAGVREYRPGDQRRYIHWRTTARSGRLAVREHEEPAKSPVVLVVAGLPAGDAGDAVASAAASIGLHALSRGRPVHCVGAGQFGEHVENGTAAEVLDWAAALEPSRSVPEDLVDDAFRRWGRRCSFVLFESERGFADGAVRNALRRGAGAQVVVAGGGEAA